MRIAIASTYVPFLKGGGTKIVEDLATTLKRAGHEVDSVMIPMDSCWNRVAEQTLAIRLLDLKESCGNTIDRLITVRYPSYALSHPNKVSWFLHHHRGAYDMWGTSWCDIPDTQEGHAARQRMIRSDNLYLREARGVYTISKNVANRLRVFNGLEADGVLYPPLPNDHLFYPGEPGDYFVYISRLCGNKRQDLAIEAMRFVRSDCRLIIVGAPDVPQYLESLTEQIRRSGVANRIQLTGWITERQKADLLANCRASLFLAYDEDYGYATLEGLHSGKPVITCQDSGASLELIEDNINGIVVPPEAAAIAAAMDRLMGDRRKAIAMGRQALRTPEALGISWDHVVERLTA